MINMVIVFLTCLATSITANRTMKDPILAAILNMRFECENNKKPLPKTDEPKINIATPKLAPELIPNTYGPAKGFLNRVCINKPEIANPEPTKIAVIDLGIL